MGKEELYAGDFIPFADKKGRMGLQMPTKKFSRGAFYEMLSFFVQKGTSIHLQMLDGEVESIKCGDLVPQISRRETRSAKLKELAKRVKSAERVLFLRETDYTSPPPKRIRNPDIWRRYINNKFVNDAPPGTVNYLDTCGF